MLKQLRSRKLVKRVFKILLVLVIPSFVMFYGWSSLERSQAQAATTYAWFKSPSRLPWPLNRWEPVSLAEMQQAGDVLKFNRQLEYQFAGVPPSMFPQGRPSELFSNAEIIREALNQRIIRRYAQKMGITVTDDELREQILRMFPESTKQAFDTYLEMRHISETQFLTELRDEVLNAKVRALFINQAKDSLFELWQEYTLQKEKLQLDYVKLLASQYAEKVAVDQPQLESFFKEHIEDYRVPAQRHYRYISVSKSDVEAQTEVTMADAEAYYKENVETHPLFRTPNEVHIRQILLKPPKTEGLSDEQRQAAVEEVRKRIEQISAEARDKNTDFTDLANRVTEDENNTQISPDGQKTQKGGDIGWISDKDSAEWGQSFVEAAVGLTEDGQISDIVSGPKGFHILKREGFKPSQPLPFDKVSDVALSAARSKIVREQLDKRIAAMTEAAEGVTALDGLAAKLGYEIKETPVINADDYVVDAKVGPLTNDKEYLATLEPGYKSGVLTTDNGAICLTLQEAVPSRLPELAEVRQRVEGDFRTARALEICKTKAAEGEEKAKKPGGIEVWTESGGLEVKTTEPFERAGAPPDFNEVIDDLAIQTYKTPVGAVRVSSLSLGGQIAGWIVWRIKNIQTPTQAEFAKDYISFQRQHLFLKQWALYEEWLADARQRWKVRLPEPLG